MKKMFVAAVLGLLFLASCAQKAEKREETKEDLSAEHMRNAGVDSAATSGHTVAPAASDSTVTK